MMKVNFILIVITILNSYARATNSKAPTVCDNLVQTNACVQSGEKYYLVEDNSKLNWFEAAHFCRRMNAQLVTIENAAELNALSDYLISRNHDIGAHSFWTAINDLGAEGNFYSIGTGQIAPYTKWLPGQPDNFFFNEHCVHLKLHKGLFQMNDFNCHGRFNYICELPYEEKPISDMKQEVGTEKISFDVRTL